MDKDKYALQHMNDFMRLDAECAALLKEFCRWLQTPEGGNASPLEAGKLAHAADCYLRNFVVDIKETGPSDGNPALARQYLSNWLILNALTPNAEELESASASVKALYKYLCGINIISESSLTEIIEEIPDAEYLSERLSQFEELTPESAVLWRSVDDYRNNR